MVKFPELSVLVLGLKLKHLREKQNTGLQTASIQNPYGANNLAKDHISNGPLKQCVR